jgi:tetrapyrrole methylase family protein/MazG family protein
MSKNFDRLVEIMARLRGEEGCPWDKEQTRESLKPFLIEEAYEVLEAIDRGAVDPLKEELGDLLFQVLFHARIAEENQEFDIDGILETTVEKMTRRHPHVFGDESAREGLTAAEVLARWEETKRKEGRNKERASSLDGVPKALPALLRAQQIQSRAARVGFDWKSAEPVREKVLEEWEELSEALDRGDPRRVEEEFGDLLFSLVNYARHLAVQPEEALRKAIERFSLRFTRMEREGAQGGRKLSDLSLEAMDRLWEKAKRDVEE